MKKKRGKFLLALTLCLSFSLLAFSACKDETEEPKKNNSSQENTWSDENVDNNGWT